MPNVEQMEIDLVIDVTETIGEPNGLFMEPQCGDYRQTAEYFRQYVIVPALNSNKTILVDLGDHPYGASWLMEVFAGLIDYGYLTVGEFKKRLFVKCAESKFYSVRINQYVAQATYGSKIYKERKEMNAILSTVLLDSDQPVAKPVVVPTDKAQKLVLVYENKVKPNNHQIKILCFELNFAADSNIRMSEFVSSNDTIHMSNLLSSCGAITMCQHLQESESHLMSGLTFNMFSCDDLEDVESQLAEIEQECLDKGISFKALRRLLRTEEVTIYD